jgi:glutathione synthase/RimK-type ligase-like ATP-grasp enzyme
VSTVVLLTTDALVHPDLDSPLLIDALTRHGATVEMRNWYDTALLDLPVDLLVLRTPWDYFDRLDEFLGTVDAFAQPVLNPPSVVRWNCHKGYLAELAEVGVPVVPTTLLSRGTEPMMPDFSGIDRIIVKPAVSGAAIGVGLFDRESPAAAEHLATLLSDQDVLVQPFIESVKYGERSLIFFGGTYSHAVRKVPADGDFRVQVNHGGSNTRHTATAIEIAAAERALAAVPDADELAYARVDLVGTVDEPLVMELELIEPELFLPMAPGSADRLAGALLARIQPGS